MLNIGTGSFFFFPPHLFEKIKMLLEGQLIRPFDWFDLVMHATPWVFLIIKLLMTAIPVVGQVRKF